ncbi:MAG: hypothetical protein GX633_04845 [Clostridiales bacterium]|nr:hypothetical protein [Limnochordia bacterium]MDD5605194.1 hypothetical protein [Dehalococcoidales bacterium]NLD87568.1 hypothetical protein [Clostridiales bacterium]
MIEWVKSNEFWTSIIFLGLVALGFSIFGGPLELGLVYRILMMYTFVGGLIWSGYTRKKGMTLIALGVAIALMPLFPILSWLNTHNLRLSIEGYALIAGEILLSFLLIWIGIKRYRNWQLEKE